LKQFVGGLNDRDALILKAIGRRAVNCSPLVFAAFFSQYQGERAATKVRQV
jgi:hypothetical protein